MPRDIRGDKAAGLVGEPAKTAGVATFAVVRRDVTAELARLTPPVPLRERLAVLRARHPLREPTGQHADKAYFDALSGE